MVTMRDIGEYVERINDACILCGEASNYKFIGEEGKTYVFKRGPNAIFITNDKDEMFAYVSYVWQYYKRYRLGIVNE